MKGVLVADNQGVLAASGGFLSRLRIVAGLSVSPFVAIR
jgi:hypothetical protein